MPLLTIDPAACTRCGLCIDACPYGLIAVGADGLPRDLEDAAVVCALCGHCVAVCPSGALAHARLPREEFIPAQKKGAVKPATVELFLKSRRSIREFKPEPLPRETLARILDTTRFAPTAVNSQNVRWVVSADPAVTRRLAGLAADWMRGMGERYARFVALWDAGREVVLRGAPHVAVACAPEDYVWSAVDCAIAVTYLDLAAQAHGLGGCWAGLLVRAIGGHPPLARALSLPEGHLAQAALMLGRPRVRYRLAPPRKPLRADWL